MRALYKHCSQTWWDYLQMVELLRTTGTVGINRILTEVANRGLSIPVR